MTSGEETITSGVLKPWNMTLNVSPYVRRQSSRKAIGRASQRAVGSAVTRPTVPVRGLDRGGRSGHALGEGAEAGGDDRAGLRDQLLRDDRLGGEQQSGNGRGVLERESRDPHGID